MIPRRAVLLVALVLLWPPELRGAEQSVALSLRELQAQLQRGLSPESTLPLTRITGVWIDERRDIVLLGVDGAPAGAPPLLPDDIAVALRSIWLFHESPGMSIDPRKDEKSPGGIGLLQDVDYFGGLDGTRAGVYAFQCDYWMKRLAAGSLPSPVPGFQRYCDLALADERARKGANRFWFYPIAPQILVSPRGDLMIFERNGVELLTEAQHSLFDFQRAREVYRVRDPLAERFAHQVTKRYDELAAAFPDLDRLRNFFALCEVFTWIESSGLATGRIRLQDWAYLLRSYRPILTHAPPAVPTVQTSFQRGALIHMIVGGVSAQVRLPRNPPVDSTGRLTTLASTVRSRRPPGSSLSWAYGARFSHSAGPVLLRVHKAAGEERSVDWIRQAHAGREGLLGIEELPDGKLAALYREGGETRLAHVGSGRIETVAEGTRAEARFHEVARDVCRRASDASLSFVHVSQEGDRILLQVGDELQAFSVGELTVALGKPLDRSSRLGRLFLGGGEDFVFYRHGRALSPGGKPAGGPLNDPAVWASTLGRHFQGRVRFHLSDGIRPARESLLRISSLRGPSDLVALLPTEGFEPGDRDFVERLRVQLRRSGIRVVGSGQEIGAAKNVLLVSGQTVGKLLATLDRLSKEGALAGRVILLSAPRARTDPARVHELIARSGALAVVRAPEASAFQAAAMILEQVGPVLREAEHKIEKVHPSQLLSRAAAKAVSASAPNAFLQRDLENLQNTVSQLW